MKAVEHRELLRLFIKIDSDEQISDLIKWARENDIRTNHNARHLRIIDYDVPYSVKAYFNFGSLYFTSVDLHDKLKLSFEEFKSKYMEIPITTTKEKILEAASKCSQAKETLKTLFPDVFEDEVNIKFHVHPTAPAIRVNDKDGIVIMKQGDYRNKGLILSDRFDWRIVEDRSCGGGFMFLILVPTPK